MKKSSFSAAEYLRQMPLDEDIQEKNGAFHIPIGAVEKALDFFPWGTQSFVWTLYQGRNAELCVAASLELVIPFEEDNGRLVTRTFVGACNFSVESLGGIPDFLATAKSMCVKNAASDAGRKFGRSLNDDIVPERETAAKVRQPAGKIKPDAQILKQYTNAVTTKNEKAITALTAVYDIKTEDYGDETV